MLCYLVPVSDAAVMYLQVCIIEADGTKECFVFDLITVTPAEKPEMVAVLAALLQDEGVTKVVHDGRRDAEALLYQLDISLTNVLDTQVSIIPLHLTIFHYPYINAGHQFVTHPGRTGAQPTAANSMTTAEPDANGSIASQAG